jgi:guanylate kinase
MQKYLIFVGASGTGKSTVKNILTQFAPMTFVNVEQYTTRKRRDRESPSAYKFVSEEQFAEEQSKLIGCCTINGKHYGSIPTPMFDTRTGIIVLNNEGLDDFIAKIDRSKVTYKIVGIHRSLEEALKVRGEERSEEYIRNEFEIYKRAEYVFENDYEKIAMKSLVDMFSRFDKLMSLESELKDTDEWLRTHLTTLPA